MKLVKAIVANPLPFSLKAIALLSIVAFLLSNHPPSKAQSVDRLARGQEVSAEDVRQDTDITYIKTAQATQVTTMVAMEMTLVDQGKDLASLNTRVTMLVSFLGVLQVGGIALPFLSLKRKEEE